MLRIAPAVAIALFAGAAVAQTTSTSVTKTAPAGKTAPTAKAAPAPHSAASIDCSKQADAKGLHGKARKSFRSSCKAATGKG